MAKGHGFSEETYDAIVNTYCERLVERGQLDATLADLSPADRQAIEDGLDRHAARQRAAGKAGW